MGLTEMPFHCLLKNVSLDLTMGVQNNSSKYCWIGRVFDLIYYSPKRVMVGSIKISKQMLGHGVLL
ncbi:Uncharacterised protein [Acinetobacter baumannii]|nr:Uncharacterised protein [Acinetobacter baumannii]SSP24033.1 Uncharacterised protein [Acinetobacter baumannii]SSP35766.1 Uncharacterised protein [Acinetobacter baumannii]SSP87719.1 Uncharacterised protein [Acinetobacter baumannii]